MQIFFSCKILYDYEEDIEINYLYSTEMLNVLCQKEKYVNKNKING